MNDIIKALIDRRSFHSPGIYKDEPVDEELINQVIEAGLWAASGMGKQSPIIIAVTNKEVRDKLAKLNMTSVGGPTDRDPFYGAPVVLVVLADKSAMTYVYDGSLTMGNMLAAADSLGLGSCWVHRAKDSFETEEGKEFLKSLGIEGDYEGIGNCILGWPAEEKPAPKPRKENRVYYVK